MLSTAKNPTGSQSICSVGIITESRPLNQAVKTWEAWIDYWAVDWHFREDTFHNEWQSYRTRKDRSLQLSITHEYDEPGEYTIVVKVIDILGNDTTKAITAQIV